MVVHFCNPCWGKLRQENCCEFQDSLRYTRRPCLKKQTSLIGLISVMTSQDFFPKSLMKKWPSPLNLAVHPGQSSWEWRWSWQTTSIVCSLESHTGLTSLPPLSFFFIIHWVTCFKTFKKCLFINTPIFVFFARLTSFQMSGRSSGSLKISLIFKLCFQRKQRNPEITD